MKNTKTTNFLSALKSMIATFLLDTKGHFLPIGEATDALLTRGIDVTPEALIAELDRQPPGTLRNRGIRHLQNGRSDSVLRK